jgi:hypothetical protein
VVRVIKFRRLHHGIAVVTYMDSRYFERESEHITLQSITHDKLLIWSESLWFITYGWDSLF